MKPASLVSIFNYLTLAQPVDTYVHCQTFLMTKFEILISYLGNRLYQNIIISVDSHLYIPGTGISADRYDLVDWKSQQMIVILPPEPLHS